jgi:hypothetical protein
VATAWATTWWPTCGEAAGHLPRRQTAADTSMATGTSLTPWAGHQPFGRRSFRKQRTVNPLMIPARYNFPSLPKAGPAGGLRQPHTGHRGTGLACRIVVALR